MASKSESYLIRIQLQIQNDKALKALTTQLDKTAKAAPKAQKAMKQATSGTKRFGQVAQNSGYQIQDFVDKNNLPIKSSLTSLPLMANFFNILSVLACNSVFSGRWS